MASWPCRKLLGGRLPAATRCNARCLDASRLLPHGAVCSLAEPCIGAEQVAMHLHSAGSSDDLELLVIQSSFRPAATSSLHMHASTSSSAPANGHRKRARLRPAVQLPQLAQDHEHLPMDHEVLPLHSTTATSLQGHGVSHAMPEHDGLAAPAPLAVAEAAAAAAAEALAQPHTARPTRHASPAEDWPGPAAQGSKGKAAPKPQAVTAVLQRPQPSPAEQLAAAQLTKRITTAAAAAELHSMLSTSTCPVNHIHVSAALKQLVHMTTSTSQQQHQLDSQLDPGDAVSPQTPGHRSTSHAYPRRPQQHVLQQQQRRQQEQRLAAHLATLALQLLPDMRMWELTTIMSSLVRLHVPLKKSYYILFMEQAVKLFEDEGTTLQGLVELLWSVARCGMRGLRVDWAAKYCAAVATRWPQLDMRCACRILHTLALLRHTPDPTWSAQLLSKVAQHASTASPRDVSNTMWALARLRNRLQAPADVLPALCSRAQELWPLFTERETALMLWSVARLEQPVGPEWKQAALDQVRSHLARMGELSLALTCYALGLLRWQPDEQALTQALWRVRQAGFTRLTPQGLGLLLYGVAQTGYVPGRGWLAALHAHVEATRHLLHPDTVELVGLAYLKFRFTPPDISGEAANGSGGGGARGAGARVARRAAPTHVLSTAEQAVTPEQGLPEGQSSQAAAAAEMDGQGRQDGGQQGQQGEGGQQWEGHHWQGNGMELHGVIAHGGAAANGLMHHAPLLRPAHHAATAATEQQEADTVCVGRPQLIETAAA